MVYGVVPAWDGAGFRRANNSDSSLRNPPLQNQRLTYEVKARTWLGLRPAKLGQYPPHRNRVREKTLKSTPLDPKKCTTPILPRQACARGLKEAAKSAPSDSENCVTPLGGTCKRARDNPSESRGPDPFFRLACLSNLSFSD